MATFELSFDPQVFVDNKPIACTAAEATSFAVGNLPDEWVDRAVNWEGSGRNAHPAGVKAAVADLVLTQCAALHHINKREWSVTVREGRQGGYFMNVVKQRASVDKKSAAVEYSAWEKAINAVPDQE